MGELELSAKSSLRVAAPHAIFALPCSHLSTSSHLPNVQLSMKMRPTSLSLASLTAASFRAAHPRPSLLALQQLSQQKAPHSAQQQVRFRAASALDAPSPTPAKPRWQAQKPGVLKKTGPVKSYPKPAALMGGDAPAPKPLVQASKAVQGAGSDKQTERFPEDGPGE